MSRVVVLGDVMLDVVVRRNGPLSPSSDTPSSIRVARGGSAASIAVALSRGGHHVRHVGAAGADGSAALVREALEREGVATRWESVRGTTGTVVSMVDEDGQRSMYTDRGANSLLSERFVLQELAEPVEHVHVSGYLVLDPATTAVATSALAHARRRGASTSVDVCSLGPLAQLTPSAFLLAVDGATSLFANSDEALVLTSRTSAEEALEDLAGRFREVMVTRGPLGALVAADAVRVHAPARSAAVLDTTGAGDAATGAYLAARLNGDDIASSLGRAMDDAARVVERLGAI